MGELTRKTIGWVIVIFVALFLVLWLINKFIYSKFSEPLSTMILGGGVAIILTIVVIILLLKFRKGLKKLSKGGI